MMHARANHYRRSLIESLEDRRMFAAGDLDSTFDVDGKLFTSQPTITSLVVQSDGKILISGGFQGGGYIARLNTNGTYDTAFGQDGVNDGIRLTDTSSELVLRGDGKIIAVGNGYVQRFNSNGTIDGTFSPTFLRHDANIYKAIVRGDNKIIVATQKSNYDEIFIYQINSNGGFDNSVDSDGEFFVPTIGMETLRDLAVQNDNKLIVVGNERAAGSPPESNFLIARFQANSPILDHTFGNISATPFGAARADFGGLDRAWAVVRQADGKMVVAGGAGPGGFALARFTTNGQLDSSFSGDGKVVVNNFDGTTGGGAWDVVQQPDGKLVAAGTVGTSYALARFNSDGSLDSTFNGNGVLKTSLITGAQYALPVEMGLASNGKIVVGGFTANASSVQSNAIFRYNGDTATASIGGLVYADQNYNGTKDGTDVGLGSKRMYLDLNLNGVLDGGEPNQLTTSTGTYNFTNLPAGKYRVRRADLPATGYFTNPTSGYYDVTLTTGQVVTGRNFGSTNYAIITGNVFEDKDASNTKTSGDGALANWRVFVDSNNNGVWDSATEYSVLSDSTGKYTLSKVKAGSYVVRIVVPPPTPTLAWTIIFPGTRFYSGTITPGATLTAKDFGLIKLQ